MKKPRRKTIRRDPEVEIWAKIYGRKKTHERPTKDVFLRLNNRHHKCDARHLAAAGYPMAILGRGDWQEVHQWCSEKFRNKRGRTYTWTGEKFWFQTETDKTSFSEQWGFTASSSPAE